MEVDINSPILLVLQGVHTFLFSLSSFWPLADRFTSGGTPATERREKSLHCSSGEESEVSLSFFLITSW